MPYLIACAATAVAGLAAAYWRCITYRRALLRERAAARCADACSAREVAALERRLAAVGERATREQYVLAEAGAVIDAAWATYGYGSGTHNEEGGTDG